MIFKDKVRDNLLQRELVNSLVYKSSDYQSFALGDAEEGTLLDTLVANAERINSGGWIKWLVHAHGLSRINTPHVDRHWLASLALPNDMLVRLYEAGICPLYMSGRSAVVGLARPDRDDVLKELTDHIRVARVFKVAISPLELRRLREVIKQQIPIEIQ